MTLNKSEEHILTLFIGYGVQRTQYFGYYSKVPKSVYFEMTREYLKMPKGLVLSIAGHNHDARARTEPLKPKWLLFGDHG